MNSDKLNELIKILNESTSIVFFGGAGVSTASNIPDFRGAHGLYKYSPEEMISHTFFMNHTQEFYEFYFEKMVYLDALPNPCHYGLKTLEDKGKLKAIITQNIDNLHQMAGSNNVIELHGSVYRNHCMKCHRFYDIYSDPFKKINYKGIPKCECGGIIKPDVTLYEEQLDYNSITQAINYISNCDTLIIAGTSLVVYPARSFIDYFRGKNVIVINLGETNYPKYLNANILEINGKVEEYINPQTMEKVG